MCLYPLTAILAAFEVIIDLQMTLRSLLTTSLSSVASMPYVLVSLWPLNASVHLIKWEETAPLDQRAQSAARW